MAVAAHPMKVYVKTTDVAASAGDEIDGILDVQVESSADMLDITDFKDATGYRARLGGLKDGSFTVSGHAEATDAPQQLLRSSLGGSTIYLTVEHSPSATATNRGFRYPVIVESYSFNGQVDGVGEFSCTMQQNGGPPTAT